jgi:hypothetical protein
MHGIGWLWVAESEPRQRGASSFRMVGLGGCKAMNKIPSDEEFARADRMMAERDRNLSQVSANVKRRFANRCPLHNVYVLWQRDVDFRIYVFFQKDKDIDLCKVNGIVGQIEDCAYEELERAGRGKRGAITVAFEYDSDENVDRNFDGDYLYRLR